MMKLNNKGLTLIEMVISFAILGVVMVSAGSLITAGSNIFGKVTTDVDLQVRSQMVIAQIRDKIVDCSGGVFFDEDGSTLYVMNKAEGSSRIEVMAFAVKDAPDGSGEKEMYYGERTVTGSGSSVTPAMADTYLAGNVTGWNAEIISSGKFSEAVLTLDFDTGNKTYTGRQTVTFRNHVLTECREISSVEDMINALKA